MQKREKIKVLIIPSWYSPAPGGVTGNFVNDFFLYIQHESIHVTALYMDGFLGQINKKLKYAFYKLEKQKIHNTVIYRYNLFLPPIRTKWSWSLWKKSWLNVFNKYTRIAGFPDVIHSHGINGGVAATCISEKYSIPVIHTEHSSSVGLSKILKDQFKIIYKKANQVTAVSKQLVSEIEETYGAIPYHIPNFVRFDLFPIKPVPPLPYTLISIGSPAIVKGMDVLIEAFISLNEKSEKSFHLILVDKIIGIQPYLAKIAAAGLMDQVNYAKEVNHNELHMLLEKSHIYISASKGETFGLTICEALSCGIPTICTKTQGTMDYFDDSMGIMIEYGNSEILVDSILHIVNNYNIWNRTDIANAIKRKINNDNTKNAYIGLYHELKGK